MLVRGTVLYDHVVSIQAHDPTTNITLVHRIGFQPGKGTIIHTQLEGSTPQVGPVFFHESDQREHFRFRCAILHLSIAQDLTSLGYRTFSRRSTLAPVEVCPISQPLMHPCLTQTSPSLLTCGGPVPRKVHV